MRLLTLFLTSIIISLNAIAGPIDESKQLIISVTDGWGSFQSRVYFFEKNENAEKGWEKKASFPAVVGKLGLGWGLGLHNGFVRVGKGDPVKHEGDKKAPAGVFKLIETFGYQNLEEIPGASSYLPQYTRVNEHSRCVDDYKSKFYNNQIYDERQVDIDWDSREELRRSDILYKLAIVADHNKVNVRGIDRSEKLGSCIFLHLWRNDQTGTAGCTAFAESNMLKLYSMLDARKKPVMVQLPRSVYLIYKDAWGLPNLN